MKKRASVKKRSVKRKKAMRSVYGTVTGKPVATLGNGMFVVKTKSGGLQQVAKPSARAGVLISKLGKALSKPGLSRRAVFGDTPSKRTFSYYVDDAKPSKIARESATGKVTYGRMVDGKFRAG